MSVALVYIPSSPLVNVPLHPSHLPSRFFLDAMTRERYIEGPSLHQYNEFPHRQHPPSWHRVNNEDIIGDSRNRGIIIEYREDGTAVLWGYKHPSDHPDPNRTASTFTPNAKLMPFLLPKTLAKPAKALDDEVDDLMVDVHRTRGVGMDWYDVTKAQFGQAMLDWIAQILVSEYPAEYEEQQVTGRPRRHPIENVNYPKVFTRFLDKCLRPRSTFSWPAAVSCSATTPPHRLIFPRSDRTVIQVHAVNTFEVLMEGAAAFVGSGSNGGGKRKGKGKASQSRTGKAVAVTQPAYKRHPIMLLSPETTKKRSFADRAPPSTRPALKRIADLPPLAPYYLTPPRVRSPNPSAHQHASSDVDENCQGSPGGCTDGDADEERVARGHEVSGDRRASSSTLSSSSHIDGSPLDDVPPHVIDRSGRNSGGVAVVAQASPPRHGAQFYELEDVPDIDKTPPPRRVSRKSKSVVHAKENDGAPVKCKSSRYIAV